MSQDGSKDGINKPGAKGYTFSREVKDLFREGYLPPHEHCA